MIVRRKRRHVRLKMEDNSGEVIHLDDDGDVDVRIGSATATAGDKKRESNSDEGSDLTKSILNTQEQSKLLIQLATKNTKNNGMLFEFLAQNNKIVESMLELEKKKENKALAAAAARGKEVQERLNEEMLAAKKATRGRGGASTLHPALETKAMTAKHTADQLAQAKEEAKKKKVSCAHCNSMNTRCGYFGHYQLHKPVYRCRDCRRSWIV